MQITAEKNQLSGEKELLMSSLQDSLQKISSVEERLEMQRQLDEEKSRSMAITQRTEAEEVYGRLRNVEDEKSKLLEDNRLLMKVNQEVKIKVVEIE